MRYFRHVWTWSWCFALLKCLIHCCIFYGDDVVCYLRTLETHNAGVTLLERNVAADIWVLVGLAARRPSRLPQLYVRPKCDSMFMISSHVVVGGALVFPLLGTAKNDILYEPLAPQGRSGYLVTVTCETHSGLQQAWPTKPTTRDSLNKNDLIFGDLDKIYCCLLIILIENS